MARKPKSDALSRYAATAPETQEPQEKKSSVNPASLANLHPRQDGKSPTKYMQINVYGYEDYLYRMARYNKMTTTKYVLSLIEKDRQEHAAEYKNLRMLSEFDKPHRESPNKKKKD